MKKALKRTGLWEDEWHRPRGIDDAAAADLRQTRRDAMRTFPNVTVSRCGATHRGAGQPGDVRT